MKKIDVIVRVMKFEVFKDRCEKVPLAFLYFEDAFGSRNELTFRQHSLLESYSSPEIRMDVCLLSLN
jgi:hypothetical protein